MVVVSIDGEVVAPEAATVSIFDRGFLFGDGLFESFRTWDGVAVDADAHLARLRASAAVLELRVGAIEIASVIAAAGGGDLRVKVIVTRGPGAAGVPFGTLGPGRVIVIVDALPPVPERVSAVIVDLPLARRGIAHKTLAYLDALVARELAREARADEAIRLDAEGAVCEGAMSNVFLVEQGAVVTPALGTGALAGVTREQVIAACGAREERVTIERLRAAEEIFVTSAIRGVVGVAQLDGDARSVGPVTARIREAYGDEMRRRAKKFVAEQRDQS